MTAQKFTIAAGVCLILIGCTGAGVAMTMVDAWWYAGIPAVIGLFLIAAAWATSKSRVFTWFVPLIAIIGIVGSFMPSGLDFSNWGSVAFISSIFRLLTILVCAIVVLRSLWRRHKATL